MNTLDNVLVTKKLLPSLILYHHRRDKALGLTYPGKITLELVYHYWRLQEEQKQEQKRVIQVAYWNAIIQRSANEIAMLVARAEKAKNKARILEQVLVLEQMALHAKEELDKCLT